MSAFDAVMENPHALNKDQVLFELAKLAESEEKTDDAVKRYKQLMQEFPLSPFSTEANLRVKVLAPEEAQESVEEETNSGNKVEQEASEPLSGEGDKNEVGQED
jgi:hypothetical protein